MSKSIIGLTFLCSVLLISCVSNERNTRSNGPEFFKSLSIKDSFVFKSNFLKGHNINYEDYESKLIFHENAFWFSFLDNNKRSILLFNLEDPFVTDSIRLTITDTVKGKTRWLWKGRKLYYYKATASFLSEYEIDADSVIKRKEFQFHKIDFDTYYYDPLSFFKIVEKGNPAVLFNYGSMLDQGSSYLDRSSNLILLQQNELYVKTGFYPRKFFESKKYYTGTLFDVDSMSHIFFTYELNDSIFKTDMNGQRIKAGVLHDNPRFIQFKWKKEQDLAYVRKYSHETEMNKRLHVLDSNRILVIKKLAGNNLMEKPVYKYFLFDQNLQKLYADTIRHGVYPNFSYKYKNGFILLSDSLSKAYYYEID